MAPKAATGYRRTDVGVIPEDWDVQSLTSTLAEPPGYGINAPAVPFDGSLPSYIRITDIGKDGRFRPAPRVSVKVNGARAARFLLRPGDLVFARTGASVGKSYLYDRRDGTLVFAGFLIRIAPNPSRLRPAFMSYYAQTQRYWDWVADNSARSGQPGVNAKEYGSLLVPVPPIPEQRAIATVLSDVDELIKSLEALIAKKRAIKQAAMQELLTGRTRLPGFGGEWETKRLGALANVASGGTPPTSVAAYYGGGIPWVAISDMTASGKLITDTERSLSHLGLENSAAHLLPVGTVLYAMYASLGECSIAGRPLCTSQAILGIQPFQVLSRDFLYYWLSWIKDKVKMIGQHGAQANLNKGMVQDFQLPLPPLPEQRAIATILSDMDAEIAALERRLDKTRAIKQGMMQQLLTGSIRLPIPDDDTEDDDAHDA